VGVHDRDQDGAVVEGRGEVVRADPAMAVDRQDGEVEAVPAAQVAAGVQDGGVLGGLGDHAGRLPNEGPR
jgi:hypothetical protein